MEPEFFFVILLVLAAAAIPFIILGLMISLRSRQERNHDDLTTRLSRIEQTVGRMQKAVDGLTKGEKPATPATAPAQTPIEAPIKPAQTPAETFVHPDLVPEPLPPTSPTPLPRRPEVEETKTPKPEWKPIAFPPPELREPVAQPEPSRFEVAAKETLRKIGHWILFGEEEASEGVPREYASASNWLLRGGVLILVMGIGFFLQYSFAHNLITPMGRVLLGGAGGLAMLVAGTQLLGRKYHLFGQGLIGAGIATLYLSVYAAHSMFELSLIDDKTTFALMIAVTCIAGGIAVRFNSLLVAVLGILGGFGTPIMLQTGVVNYVGLYSYLLILGVGVFGVSYKKNWHLLNYLSFLGTYGLLFATMNKWHYQPANFWEVMPFLIAFFALYSTMTFVFNLVHRKKSSLLEVLGLWVNAGVFFATSYVMVKDRFSSEWVAVVSLSLAAFYAAHIYYFLIRRLLDRELLLSFTAMSSFFLAVTIPLVLSNEWITASWAIQALVMLWIAGKLESEFLRQIAYLLYVVVLVRFGFVDLHHQYGYNAQDVLIADYLSDMVGRLMCLGIPIASLAGAGWLLRHDPPKSRLAIERDNDISAPLGRRGAIGAVVALVVGMMFLALHLELNQSVGFFCPSLRMPMLSMLWIALCGFLLREYRLRSSKVLLTLLAVFVVGMVLKLFCFDLMSWHLVEQMRYGHDGYSFLDGAMRLLDFGAIVAFLACGYHLLRQTSDNAEARGIGGVFGYAALALSLVFCTLEVNSFLYHFMRGSEMGGVSVVWALFALGMIIAGMWKDARAIRYCGLALFAVVAWKVLFSDLKHLDQIYRIVAFLVLGVLMLCGSFVYLKCRPMIAAIKNRKKSEDDQE